MFTPQLLDLERRAKQNPELGSELFMALLNHDEFDAARSWLHRLVAEHRTASPYRALRCFELYEGFTGEVLVDADALRHELGLNFAFEALTVPEAKARLKLLSPTVRLPDDVDDAPVRLVEGALQLPHLEVKGEVLIVTGSLEVTGSIIDSNHPVSVVVVLGSVTCGQAVLSGQWHVHGSFEVRGLAYLNSGNDFEVIIGGDAHLEVLLEDGMHTTIGGELTGRHLASQHNQVTSRSGRLPRGDASAALLAAIDGEPTIEALTQAAQEERRLTR